MSAHGWKQLLTGWPCFRGEGHFPMPAYSEYMPPPYLVRKPYGGWDLCLLPEDDPWGWPITEYEEALAILPGFESIARQLVHKLVECGRDRHRHGLAHGKLLDNPYWSLDLARKAAELAGERFVLLLPLALSCTLDDKSRVRWTLFGGSEQGPARPFWRGFFTAPSRWRATSSSGPTTSNRCWMARSTLFNTDADEFSDAGIPTILFMENYDINRVGYHDSEDDMRNINLDYGAALAAITIETVARIATEQPTAKR
jgi:hypothetical protein